MSIYSFDWLCMALSMMRTLIRNRLSVQNTVVRLAFQVSGGTRKQSCGIWQRQVVAKIAKICKNDQKWHQSHKCEADTAGLCFSQEQSTSFEGGETASTLSAHAATHPAYPCMLSCRVIHRLPLPAPGFRASMSGE